MRHHASTSEHLSTPQAPRFGLYLSDVRVQDFRVLRDVHVALTRGTTVLVGENNSGKTAFLEALAVALGERRARVEDLIHTPQETAREFQIDLRINPTEGEDLPDAVRDVVGAAIQLEGNEPEYFTLRVIGKINEDGGEVTLRRTFLKGWAADRVTATQIQPLPTPLVGRELMGLLNYDLLDARRDIIEQLRGQRTWWGRATSNMDVEASLKQALESSLRTLGAQVTEGSGTLRRTRDDLRALSAALSHGHLSVDIEVLPANLEDLTRAMEILITAPESAPFPVSTQGMGTRSLAALLVFRSYVNLVRGRRQAGNLLSVAAFEEPEAHLHPQAQRAVFDILGRIGGQRIVSTHSAEVAAVADFMDFRLFRRWGPETVVSQMTEDQQRALESPELTGRFIQRQNPQVFFARVVVVAEGQTEAAALPAFALKRWPRGFQGIGVTLVHTEGAGNSKHVLPLLQALAIPWVMLCDGDPAGDKGRKAAFEAIGHDPTKPHDNVFRLDAGKVIEDLLWDAGGYDTIRRASAHADKTIDWYRDDLHGTMFKKGHPPRDFQAEGWEERLGRDFLRSHKGEFGARVVEALPQGSMPGLICSLFDRIDKLRGAG